MAIAHETPTTITTTPATGSAVSAAEVQALRESDPAVRLLDVRTPGEYHSAHIAGSYNVPLDQLGGHARELAALAHPIVLVCQSGARATKAMDELRAAGKADLRLLEGGMNAWRVAGGDVVEADEARWALERQVRLVAGSIVLTSILASIFTPAARVVAGFIGAGLTFSAVSNTCAMGTMLGKLPYNQGPGCDVDAVVRELRDA